MARPISTLAEGAHWGRLACIRCEWIERNVGTDDVPDWFAELRYTLVCECGRSFNKWARDFPGRSRMRDCVH
mgnify:CR=1 FL=1